MMSTIPNEDKIEILDDGNHLAWADVSNGHWSFSPAGLAVGPHSLTAKYQDKVSAAWRVEVAAPENVENFDSLTEYYYPAVQLPFFSASMKTPGTSTGGSYSGMGSTVASGLSPEFSGRVLSINVVVNADNFPYRTCVVEIDFKQRYSIIVLACAVEHAAGGTTSTMKVLSDQVQAPPIANVNLREWPSRAARVVTYGSAGARNIAKIQLQVSVPYPLRAVREIIWIDNLRMIP